MTPVASPAPEASAISHGSLLVRSRWIQGWDAKLSDTSRFRHGSCGLRAGTSRTGITALLSLEWSNYVPHWPPASFFCPPPFHVHSTWFFVVCVSFLLARTNSILSLSILLRLSSANRCLLAFSPSSSIAAVTSPLSFSRGLRQTTCGRAKPRQDDSRTFAKPHGGRLRGGHHDPYIPDRPRPSSKLLFQRAISVSRRTPALQHLSCRGGWGCDRAVGCGKRCLQPRHRLEMF